MKNRSISAFLIVSILFLSPVLSMAQQPSSDVIVGSWASIKSLPLKDRLVIDTKDGKRIKGPLLTVSDETIGLSKGKNVFEVKRDNIFQIYRLAPKSRKKGVLIGAAIAGGFMAVAGTAAANDDTVNDFNKLTAGEVIAGTIFMAGLGAAIGYFASSGHERVLIYEAKR